MWGVLQETLDDVILVMNTRQEVLLLGLVEDDLDSVELLLDAFNILFDSRDPVVGVTRADEFVYHIRYPPPDHTTENNQYQCGSFHTKYSFLVFPPI